MSDPFADRMEAFDTVQSQRNIGVRHEQEVLAAQANVAAARAPDLAAKALKASRVTGIPAGAYDADYLKIFDTQAQQAAVAKISVKYPKVATFLANPDNAAVAQDDYDNLGVLGKLWYGAKNTGASLKAGFYTGTSGLYGAIETAAKAESEYNPIQWAQKRLFGQSFSGMVGEFAERQRKTGQAIAQSARPKVDNYFARNLLQGVESTPVTAIGVGASILTGNPATGALVMGGSVGGSESARALDAGLSPARAVTYGASQGLIELATEKLPASRLLADLAAKTPFATTFFHQILSEVPREQVATVLQDMNEWAVLNPDKPFMDYVKARPAAAADTLIATLGGVGATTIVTRGAQVAANATGKAINRVAASRKAQQDGEFLDKLATAAQDSKTRGRDPQAFESLVAALSADTDAENIYIPAEKVREYLQSQDWDSVEFWQEYDQEIADGTISNGDVVIPIAKAAAHLAGTPAWEALKGDMRLSPGGESINEAKASEGALDDDMAAMAESISQQHETAVKADEPRQRLIESVVTKLTNAGHRLADARKEAELVANTAASRAADFGTELTGNEFDDVAVNQILPAGLAPMVAADNLSLVVKAMRSGGKERSGKAKFGPSLIDFIRSRGGIDDTGGDLEAIGFGKLKGISQKGQTKLIRKSRGDVLASAGPSLMGSDGQQNSNTPDELAMRAWEAGYFPEFTERPSVNDLLDALAEGNSGRHRYVADNENGAQTEQMRMAAQDLYQILDQQGIDPDKATDKEIKAAVERFQEQASGRSFAQEKTYKGAVDYESTGNPVFDAAINFRRAFIDAGELPGEMAFSTNRHGEYSAYFASGIGPDIRVSDHSANQNFRVNEASFNYKDATPESAVEFINQVAANTEKAKIEKAREIAERDAKEAPYIKRFNEAKESERHSIVTEYAPWTAQNRAGRKKILDRWRQRTLDQSYGDGPRGRVTFTTDGKAVIDLFAESNASTFIHEMGHVWLEQLQADAALADGPQRRKDMWATVEAWFKDNGHVIGADGIIPTEAHELWARGVERFTMEGKAPSSILRKAFDAFRSWMLSIYQIAENLKAPITPEIRDVMARLFATDEEIAQAHEEQNLKALFDSVESAAKFGMNEAAYKDYVKAATEAKDEAFDRLLFKTMEAVRRERTKAYQDEREGVAADIRASVDQRPMFRALAALRQKDGPKLNKQWLIDTYGEDVLTSLPKGVPPIYKNDGVDADIIAEASGFSTGDEMVKALIGVADRRAVLREGGDKRSARDSIVDEETDAIMTQRHGDPLSDGSIQEEALALIHSEKQGELQATELRVLSRKTTNASQPTPYRIARLWASEKIRTGQVKDVASRAAIQRYLRAASNAGKAAEQAYMAGDTDEAFKQKQAQMLNNALVAEAKEAADAIDVAVARMSRLAKRRTIKSMDQDYLERIHDLLEKVDLKQRSQVSIDRQGSFEAWRAEQEAKGHDIVTPPSFADTEGTTHWSRLSVEKLLGLDETIKQIAHLGRMKQTLLDGKERAEFDAIVAEAQITVGMLPPKPPSDLMEPSRYDAIKSRVADMDASLLKMETVFDWLDGGNSNGVFNRIVFRPIADAQAREKDMLTDYTGRLTDLLKAVPKPQLKRWSEKVVLPELLNRETGNPWVMTRDQLISMALNMGNEGNIQRLTDGYGWNEATVRQILNRELSAADWQYVQGVWDVIETLWPDIAAMERRVNGIEPDKVEAVPLETKHGTLRGGYFPAVYDPRKNLDAEANAAKSSDIFENTYTKATTRASSTKERADKVKRPIHLSLGVINRHVGEVIHDITHREAIMQGDKFLSSRRIMKAVDETLGPEVRKQFRPWLQHIANEWALDRKGVAGWDAFAKKLRTNTSIVGMGFRVSTILMQVAGYSNSFEKVGAKWVAPQLMKAADPRAYRFVMERSSEVRNRMDTLERDVRENVKQLAGRTDLLANARKFAFYGIGYMDRVVVIPTWLGAYNRGISEGMSEADAGYFADKAVRQSQGAGAAKDLAAVQRSNEWMRLATMFYSYQSAVYQRFRTLGRDVSTAGVRDIPDLLARSFWLIAVPPLLSELLAGRGPDDDEDWGMWSFQKMLAGLFGPIPIARDVVNAAQSGFGYTFTPAARAFETGLNVKTDVVHIIEGDDTKRATRNALELTGYALGLPTGQLASATQFIVDVSEDDQDPETVGDWAEGLTKGKISDD